MNRISLDVVTRQEQAKAAAAPSGRSASTVHGGHDNVLSQTVIAMNSGVELSEHENPGEATVLVLAGGSSSGATTHLGKAAPATSWSFRTSGTASTRSRTRRCS